jgi:polysaccharide pyruvyl transferase WcaK-like protein
MRSLRPRVQRRFRDARSTVAAFQRSAALLRDESALVLYVGAVGRGRPNLGDEALYTAITRQFPAVRFARSLRSRGARSVYGLTHTWSRGRASYHAMLLGGGTLIGRSGWRPEVESVLAADPQIPMFMLGVGVEDPQFEYSAALTSHEELARWRPLLQKFRAVTVRGPRSRTLLNDIGVDAKVVGDPALLLAQPEPRRAYRMRHLGMNVATIDAIWGGQPTRPREVLTTVARRLRNAGWQIQMLVFHPDDMKAARALAAAVGDGIDITAEYRHADRMLTALSQCHLVVAQRLHAAVLASALAVPAIMLEYRPKCRDFMASIDRDDLVLRTDEIDADALCDRLLSVAAQRDGHAAHVADAVIELQARLHDEADRIRTEIWSPSHRKTPLPAERK